MHVSPPEFLDTFCLLRRKTLIISHCGTLNSLEKMGGRPTVEHWILFDSVECIAW